MAVLEPHYSKEEFVRRGQSIYERDIRPRLEAADDGKFVAIDIDSGAYELDRDDYAATERLVGHHPDAQIWLLRVGQRTAYRLGGVQGAGRHDHRRGERTDRGNDSTARPVG